MNIVILKVNQAIERYYAKHKTMPNAVLINEEDMTILKALAFSFGLYEKSLKAETIGQLCGLKVIPIKYGEIQVVEVIE